MNSFLEKFFSLVASGLLILFGIKTSLAADTLFMDTGDSLYSAVTWMGIILVCLGVGGIIKIAYSSIKG